MVLVPPLSPLQDSPGLLAVQCLLPLSSPLLPIASSTSVSVSSAVHLQQRLSPVVRPSEVYNPPAYCRPNALLLVSCPASLRGFAPPPPPLPVWLLVLGLGVGGGAKETAPPAMVLSSSTSRHASPGIACLRQRSRSLFNSLGAPFYVCPPPPPPSPFPRTTVRVPIPPS